MPEGVEPCQGYCRNQEIDD